MSVEIWPCPLSNGKHLRVFFPVKAGHEKNPVEVPGDGMGALVSEVLSGEAAWLREGWL